MPDHRLVADNADTAGVNVFAVTENILEGFFGRSVREVDLEGVARTIAIGVGTGTQEGGAKADSIILFWD